MINSFFTLLLNIVSGIISFLPLLRTALLIYAVPTFLFSLARRLLWVCRYLTRKEGKNQEKKRRNTVSFTRNDSHRDDTFQNKRDYWNNALSGEQQRSTNKIKKTKSLDFSGELPINSQVAERGSNLYGKEKHKTIFIDDDSSEELELYSSDDESFTNSQEDLTDGVCCSSDTVDAKCDHDFVKFAESNNLLEILDIFYKIKENLGLEVHPWTFKTVFPILKSELKSLIPFRYEELFRHLEKRSEAREYHRNTVASGKKVLIIGAGPSGLRMAIEMQYLGAETTVIEARPYIDRNNVLKLWTFVTEDLKSLGAKKLYPQIGTGSVNHISIRILQLILLKMSLLLGTQVLIRETFKSVREPTNDKRWTVVSEIRCEDGSVFEHEEEYDIVICASGRKVPVPGFERKSLEAKMSIAITANFVNNNSVEERKVKEIPGLSKQYDLEFFKNLENKTGIRLENIVYYKDLTHYFVMTAKKDSLIKKGVIKDSSEDRDNLLNPENVDRAALEAYAIEAASFSTNHFSTELPRTPLAEWKGKKDVSIFDFTNLYTSKNACRVQERKGHRLLLGLVGDSLMEPFWPEGTGIGRGFLSVFDTAWLVKRFLEEPGDQVYEVIREREKLYSLLRQTSDSKLKGNYKNWTINPKSRYPTTTFEFNQNRIHQLYDTDIEDQLDVIPLRRKEHTKNSKSWTGRMVEDSEHLGTKRDTIFLGD